MQLEDERAYINQFSMWGGRKHDPANTDHIKSVDPHHDRKIWHDLKVKPSPPNSRFLSPYASTYLL